MSDIQYWDDTLTEEIETLQSMMDKISGMSSHGDKVAAIDRAKARLRGAAGTKRSFKMEIRLIQDVNSRRSYEQRLNALDQQLKALQSDLKAIESDANRSDLFVDRGDAETGGRNNNGTLDGVKAGDALLREAAGIQDKTQDSLDNTRNMIAASKEVGLSTLEELERQRDVISSIERETDRIDDNLARAEALLKQFGRRMASDHFIQCFAVINCLLLIGVVIYVIVKKGNLTGPPAPPPPA